jgi:pimeloyl-ACP methyl ester carboxylesterase
MASSTHAVEREPPPIAANLTAFNDAWAYWTDAWQRSLLYCDVMRQRSGQYAEHVAKTAPHVLKFDCELVMDGRELERPVNYLLARVKPPAGSSIDLTKRPFVIVDPRAGHGPGIGGFKADSELGVAFKAGHPCYFIGFLPEPVPGQTIEDVTRAEIAFIERVVAMHPEADGRPAVIGNCQAGWAVAMAASLRPDLFGPLILAGSPLSYWAGVHGENPMRYTAGLLGGSWLTALAGDLGNGKFDGAWLVANFENLNPANTLWSKQHNLYAKIDTEAPRYLEFEQWWDAHIFLNAEEMQFIADELFIGNKLSEGKIVASDGSRFDMRAIKSPVIVFCSKADNITPPPQALDWILDLYDSEHEIRAYGQTIVYVVHPSIGHLGIFVSGSVAKKEHGEFASNIDLIDVLPPGLYEAVLVPKQDVQRASDFVAGNYMVRFETRTLADIRALGGNDARDNRMFEAVARVSDINRGLYRLFLQPYFRACSSEASADALRRLHPLRLQYEMFAPQSPLMRPLQAAAGYVSQHRTPVPADNPFWQAQEMFSGCIESWLNAYRDWRDQTYEMMFTAIYASPVMQAALGLGGVDEIKTKRNAAHDELVNQRINELRRRIAEGGPREAAIRALIYVRWPDGVFDERGFNFLRTMRHSTGKSMSLAEFKQTVREQFFMLLIDERRAVEAIPVMLARDPGLAERLRSVLRRMLETLGPASDAAQSRLAEIQALVDHAEEHGAHDAPRHVHTPSRPPNEVARRSKH